MAAATAVKCLLATLLIASLPGQAGAARVRHGGEMEQKTGAKASVEAKATWLKHDRRFCLDSDVTLECDGETVMSVYSAFYAKAMRSKCDPLPGSGDSCKENATDEVLKLCNKKKHCIVPSKFHPSTCGGFLSMRAVWNCVAGTASTAEEDVKEANMEDDPDSVHATPEKGDLQAKDVAKKVRSNEDHHVAFTTCYRHTRMSLLKQFSIFSRLTDCPGGESCFKLTWQDGRVYKDPKVPPHDEEVMEASLADGQDGWAKTFFSFGLKRNDYETWGVCLPKDKGTDFAVALFNTLKSWNS